MPPTPQATPFLPHLNGLRALAILGVLLYHLRAAYCPAGYFGVDIFLVLSGFLLFRSLLAPGTEESFRYRVFLQKKAWRILPSWFAVTVLTSLLAALLLFPAPLAETMRTAAASAVAVADYSIDHSGDYFNPLSQQNPLLHLWYLSITQQLYLIAPLLIIPLARAASRRAAALLLAGLGLLSFAFHVTVSLPGPLGEQLLRGIGASSAYYHLIPRFWEVAAGAGVALLPGRHLPHRLCPVAGMLGLAGAAASFLLFRTGSSAVYLTVFSTLLAIRYADSGWAGRLLSLRPAQALGTISFSLYLWHWPLMVFWKYCCFDTPGPWDELGMLVSSLLLATLAHRVLERRLRMPTRAGWRRNALLLSLPLVFFPACSLQQRAQHAAATSPLGQTILLQHPVVESEPAALKGLERLPELHLASKPLRLGVAHGTPTFLLLGDSHAQHLYDALNTACREAGLRGIYLNNTVAPYHGLIQPQMGADTCRWNPSIEHLLLNYLDAHPEIRHVLIAQCWQMRMGEGHALDGGTGRPLTSREARQAVTGPGIGAFCDLIRERGREPVLLGETPRFSRPYPQEEWLRREMLGVPQRNRSMTRAEFEQRHAFPLATLRQLARQSRAQLIELIPALQVGEACPARVNGEFWYYDANHLTPVAARRVVSLILQYLQNTAATSPRSAGR